MNNLLIAIIIITTFNLIFGFILSFVSINFKITNNPIIEKIDQILPQNQCGQCDYSCCLLYAKAIVNNNEIINKCLPGGKQVMLKIANLLNMAPQNIYEYKIITKQKIAFIDEINCIGCNKCINVCPVDAIIGAPHTMHTVVKKFCTGCNICINHCPTNCISMLSIKINIEK
ncbi:MAG: electron transport complex subunit RsxB [Arsenophonus endosymbiont of Ceratovacuna japonica]